MVPKKLMRSVSGLTRTVLPSQHRSRCLSPSRAEEEVRCSPPCSSLEDRAVQVAGRTLSRDGDGVNGTD